MPFRRRSPSPRPADAPPLSARTLALRLLSRRDHTMHELTAKLLAKGLHETDVEPVVADLAAAGYLDDRRTAAAHVRTAARVKGRGPRRIQLELEARGVDADAARAAVSAVSPEDIDEAIRRIVERRHPARPIPADAKRRLFQHLLRRGFSSGAIGRVLNRR